MKLEPLSHITRRRSLPSISIKPHFAPQSTAGFASCKPIRMGPLHGPVAGEDKRQSQTTHILTYTYWHLFQPPSIHGAMYADPRIKRIESKFKSLRQLMNERFVRCWAAVEARDLGRGGVSVVAHALGMSRTTIYTGLEELPAKPGPVRRPGGQPGCSRRVRRVRAISSRSWPLRR